MANSEYRKARARATPRRVGQPPDKLNELFIGRGPLRRRWNLYSWARLRQDTGPKNCQFTLVKLVLKNGQARATI